ncbi:flagellar export protein FliJ [Accumulibacter sp.]|uniref:flagellar export protein FliJ n=1 Tax=Accumulibacter sp. TaxID=2053492 RepID=UPI0026185991|nr:flagellar export protein FliJ [Accumulibacter sp.]
MTRPFSLQTVLELMQSRADEATQRLARLLAAERDARNKLALLRQYRDEYALRFRQAAQQGLGQPEWRNYQEFMNRLDQAVDQQSEAVRQQESRTAAGQAAWQQQRSRLQAFDALSQRHRASEARSELRQEQKAQDEFASRGKEDDPGT